MYVLGAIISCHAAEIEEFITTFEIMYSGSFEQLYEHINYNEMFNLIRAFEPSFLQH